MTDPRTLPNDRFGYSVYSLVSHASPEQVRLVADVREAVGQARAVIPAHVTVRGTFYGISSLGFSLDSVELMGRVGPAFGGEWKLIESFPLAPRAS